MPLVQTRGAASAQGFGEFAQATVANYIEDVFSTYLYTGDGSSAQNINNGIDLAGKGGMVWVKSRSNATTNVLVDTNRFVSSSNIQNLFSDSTAAASASANEFGSFNSNGFSIPYNTTAGWTNFGTRTFVSWTFREQPKFFDVVTYTGDGTNNRNVAHSLGAIPGCVIFKRTDSTGDWQVSHRSLGEFYTAILNSAAAAQNYSLTWLGNTATNLNLNTNVNQSGATYVAYLFAHDAGGFGLTGTDNVISCGGYTGDETANRAITLGYEPQWILWKNASNASGLSETNWQIYDTMRGWLGNATGTGGDSKWLQPNSSSAEGGENAIAITPTGIAVGRASGSFTNRSGDTYIYIAIRRGPMKVPTLGTSVFKPMTTTGDGNSVRSFTGVGFPPDLVFPIMRASPGNHYLGDRLRGSPKLETTSTVAEGSGYVKSYDQDGWTTQADSFGNSFGFAFIDYLFRRAPGFFDEVCYTGTGTTNRSISHNLQAAPELLIIKTRNAVGSWATLTKFETSNYVELNLNSASEGSVRSYVANQYISSKPSSTVFTVNDGYTNTSAETYVAYLFATCANVSKVGSYTGTGTTQTINCGFTGGARFVLIKRYDPDFSGDWYVWDSARGIIAGNDPYLLLNTTAAEVTNTDYIDTAATGFEISSTAPAAINASAGSFIFFAVS